MNKELEEAIKNMQKFVKCKQNMTAITAKEMSLVLKELERLQEENSLQRWQLNSAFDNGFIHKDKIREKIEKLNKNRDMISGGYTICILKELLEGK